MSEGDSIGFWNGTETVDNHFAELGAVAVLSQAETKKVFGEAAEKISGKEMVTEEGISFVESPKEKRVFQKEKELLTEHSNSSFLEMPKVQMKNLEKEQEGDFGKVFRQEQELADKRKVIPVTEEKIEQMENVSVEVSEVPKKEKMKREEEQTLSEMDIEKLMRQMTRKLWEEREGCGRRLR